ncbi:MAG: hypothetical protein AMJ60_08835 [Desulfobacterales bacterium SG8_35]|nr:MAG: hypothetical protein AMJ60_08835 [Desulfobacterales bacterium SG8_35]
MKFYFKEHDNLLNQFTQQQNAFLIISCRLCQTVFYFITRKGMYRTTNHFQPFVFTRQIKLNIIYVMRHSDIFNKIAVNEHPGGQLRFFIR